ncbi:uncharacterized protein LOC144628060 [Oculina patagonica]
MLFFSLGIMMLTTVAAAKISVSEQDEPTEITAFSFITPNSKPPPGTETPVKGTVKLMQGNRQRPPYDHTIMIVHISGLPPYTPHGFHIHEFGDIVTDGCQSTGGHYNPFNHTHGGPQDQIRHVGDLGNLVTDQEGVIDAVLEDHVVSLIGDYTVIGRAFVIHQKRDDLGRGTGPARNESLKTGNAGPRLGCGVIFDAASN